MNVKDIKTTSTSCTDWEKIDQMTDEEIDYSDIPPLTEDFFAKAKLRQPNHVLIAPDTALSHVMGLQFDIVGANGNSPNVA